MWFIVLQFRGLNGSMGKVNQLNSIFILINVIVNVLIIPVGYIHDRYYFSLSESNQKLVIMLKFTLGNSLTCSLTNALSYSRSCVGAFLNINTSFVSSLSSFSKRVNKIICAPDYTTFDLQVFINLS